MNLVLIAGAGVGKGFYRNVIKKFNYEFNNIKIIVPIGNSFKSISNMIYRELNKEKDDFILMGHCFGGLLSINILSNYKRINRLKGLILVNSSYNFTFIDSNVIKNSGEQFTTYTEDSITSVISGLIPREKLHKQFDIAFKVNLEDRLNGINVPTLILSSDKDGFFDTNKEMDMYKRISGAKLKIINNARHLGLLTNITEYNNTIYKWLKAI